MFMKLVVGTVAAVGDIALVVTSVAIGALAGLSQAHKIYGEDRTDDQKRAMVIPGMALGALFGMFMRNHGLECIARRLLFS